MKPIVLDFFRRWWWVFTMSLLISALTPLSGQPVILAPLAPILLLFDAQRGGIRPLRLLPLTLRQLADAIWIVAVLLLPLASLLLMIPAGFYRSFGQDGDLIWFRIAVQGYVALGYAATMLLPAIFMDNRPPEHWYQYIVQGILGGTWGLSFAALGFVVPNLPKSPETIQTWHVVLFAAVPFALILSYLFSSELIRRRAGHRREKSTAHEGRAMSRHGVEGIPAFLLNLPVRAAGITLFVYLTQQAIFALLFSDAKTSPGNIASMQCAIFGVIFAALLTENAGLRALRVLPLRSSQLAMLLSTPALATALTVCLIGTWQVHPPTGRQPLPLELAFIVAGLGLLATATAFYYPRAGKVVLIFTAATIMPLLVIVPPKQGWGIGIGIVAGIAGFTMLVNGIRRSSSFYQPRRMFGMAVDQPQG